MPVRIRKDNKKGIYSYEFEFRGKLFSGSTGKTTRREAEAVERAERDKAEAAWKNNEASFGKTLTLAQAAERWYEEKGKHRADPARYVASIDWLLTYFGAHIHLHDITESRIAAMVAKRRGESDLRIKHGAKRLVSPATVNRTATVPLREIIVRARDVWQVQVAPIKWKNHLLKEPKERVREATAEEEAGIMAQLARGYDTAVRFAFLTACRRMEIIGLKWTDVSFPARQFTVNGKGGRARVIPMTQEIFDLLWAEQGNHPDSVFTFASKYTRRFKGRDGVVCKHVRGERYPLSDEGFASAMEQAVAAAGVSDFRMHDTRHTMASRVARKGNLKVAQRLLGHSDIRMTMRYVHVNHDDVLHAMENATATSIPTKNPTTPGLKVVK